MSKQDRSPLQDTPVTRRIFLNHNNRLGAVYSSLYMFWLARVSFLNSPRRNISLKKDSYSLVVFSADASITIEDDSTSSPDGLLNELLQHQTKYGTSFLSAIQTARLAMERNWSPDRSAHLISKLFKTFSIFFPSQSTSHNPPLGWRGSGRRSSSSRSMR